MTRSKREFISVAAIAIAAYVLAFAASLACGVEFEVNKQFAIPVVGDDATAAFTSQQQMVVATIRDGKPVLEFVAIGGSPGPGPEPGPKPEPVPPTPSGKLRLLWIEESADRTPGQAIAITDAGVRKAIRDAGWTLRVVDDDVVDESGQAPPDLAPYIDEARTHGLPRLIAIDENGSEVFAAAAPADLEGFKAVLATLGLRVGDEKPKAPEPDDEVETLKEAAETAVEAASSCPTGTCPTSSGTRYIRVWRR